MATGQQTLIITLRSRSLQFTYFDLHVSIITHTYFVTPPNYESFSMSQIHPVISRLCASIQGTSPARLADCLGLDSSKVNSSFSKLKLIQHGIILTNILVVRLFLQFQSKSSEAVNDDRSNLPSFAADEEERYQFLSEKFSLISLNSYFVLTIFMVSVSFHSFSASPLFPKLAFFGLLICYLLRYMNIFFFLQC